MEEYTLLGEAQKFALCITAHCVYHGVAEDERIIAV